MKRGSKLVTIKAALVGLYVLGVVGLVWFMMQSNYAAVLDPVGAIGIQQRNLLQFATVLMLVVVVPVFMLTIGIVWKYRAGNKKAKYSPGWDGNRLLEGIWWGFPFAIIVILAFFTYTSSHELDPYRPIKSDKPALTIQVVSLQWKWLFIYPDQQIAAVNQLKFPEKTPINFVITSDAPMNSFWIPSLGGQVYAMSGMTTKLHLITDKVGTYRGSSANISGEGFAAMNFNAQSLTETDFKNWTESAKRSTKLGLAEYNQLALPSKDHPGTTYSLTDNQLYDKILMKYTGPGGMTHGNDKKPKESY